MVDLGGGSQESSGSSVQGFRDLPPEIQDAFKALALDVRTQFPNVQPATTRAFTPLAEQAGETKALNAVNQGFTPTAQSLQSDIAMQENPYDRYVIDEINRQATGQKSILNQSLNSAGQIGSNRQLIGANDIDLSRLNQIGAFKQGQFNTSLNNALSVLPQQRAADAQTQLQAGSFRRGLQTATQQAPINALARFSQILGVLPTNSGQSSNSSSGWEANFGFL